MSQSGFTNNVLIVDDTPENLSVLRQLLTEEGYQVRPALSGEVAIKAVKAEIPDLILLDEPFSGVDPIAVADLQNMIRFLADRGIGAVS